MRQNWTIWDDFARMAEEMDELFSPFIGSSWMDTPSHRQLLGPGSNKKGHYPVRANYRRPLTDIYETEKNYVATLEMPGVKKDDIRISATDDGVSVKVEKDEEFENKDKKGFYCCERRHTGFYRHFSLPEGTDSGKIKADLKDGVLKLEIPKTEKAKKKQIDIKVN
jgi:HSP20 family protein